MNYYGETIELLVYTTYLSETEPEALTVQHLTTKSKKFRTKSGMGVGSTRKELIENYIYYPNFSVNESYDETEAKGTTYLRLRDSDAGTELSFTMVNNIVTVVTIYLNDGGC